MVRVHKRSTQEPYYMGSLKPNIGHLKAGSGVIGFIKTVIAVNKGNTTPQANLSKLNLRMK